MQGLFSKKFEIRCHHDIRTRYLQVRRSGERYIPSHDLHGLRFLGRMRSMAHPARQVHPSPKCGSDDREVASPAQGYPRRSRARPCRDRKEPRTTGAPMRSLQIDMALLDGERLRVMARAEMPRGNLIEGGLVLRATLACHRTARVEPAAGRRINRAWDITA